MYYASDRAEELQGVGVVPPRPGGGRPSGGGGGRPSGGGGGRPAGGGGGAGRPGGMAVVPSVSAGQHPGGGFSRPAGGGFLPRGSAVRTQTPQVFASRIGAPLAPRIAGGLMVPGGGAAIVTGGGGGAPSPGGAGLRPFTPRAPRLPGAGGVAPRPRVARTHRPSGRPHRHPRRPGGGPWWQPWQPSWGYWPDWAPGFWSDWGVWVTDLVPIDAVDTVVLWIDRCSPEYAAAAADGLLTLPSSWEGYPVVVRYTCGTEVDEGLNGLDLASYSKVAAVGAAVGGLVGYVVAGKRSALIGAGLGAVVSWYLAATAYG